MNIPIRVVPWLKMLSASAFVGLWVWFAGPMLGFAVVAGIMLHEGGHLLALRHYGIKHGGVWLVPCIGAVILPNEAFRKERDDSITAAMGPICGIIGSLALSLVVMPLLMSMSGYGSEARTDVTEDLLFCMGVFNLFNLLPFFPMDGGRIWRAAAMSIGTHAAFSLMCLVSVATAWTAYHTGVVMLWVVLGFGLREVADLWLLRPGNQVQIVMGKSESCLHLAVWVLLVAACIGMVSAGGGMSSMRSAGLL